MRKDVESAEAIVVKIDPEREKERRAEGPRECNQRKSLIDEAKRATKSEGATTTVAPRARGNGVWWNPQWHEA